MKEYTMNYSNNTKKNLDVKVKINNEPSLLVIRKFSSSLNQIINNNEKERIADIAKVN
ncbi:hypothetical protein KQI38_15790 [Tissierella carlieri]|uniref:Uncharacterized protein n=1 Tax=Tissierella carlieri TaxID=689904 RepID=A0ABT1SEC8_9FIRM|nr:hypothetical protein [Tissierella carlieri]MBU5313484.1 hypothetical protein [Tissierella carlieri]MCQ4924727.1 hypothetical protein [Tissierella carlieri]